MEAEGGEFQDWEVLHSEPLIDEVAEVQESSDLVGDSEGMIQTNYFSLDSPNKNKNNMVIDDSEVSSKSSDNPSWIDPAFETRYPRKLSAESWSDSSSDVSVDKRFNEFEGKSDVGFVQNDQNGVEDLIDENSEKFSTDCRGVEGVQGSDELGMEKDGILGEGNSEREVFEGEGGIEGSGVEKKREKRGVVWWKLPIELLRYCVFKGPVWTVSVAAAFLGFVVLGRRLYKMKKKSRDVGPRVTMEDKKISQFITRAARLNEAFSVVKRVPVIRPSLPAAGLTPWPVVSLR